MHSGQLNAHGPSSNAKSVGRIETGTAFALGPWMLSSMMIAVLLSQPPAGDAPTLERLRLTFHQKHSRLLLLNERIEDSRSIPAGYKVMMIGGYAGAGLSMMSLMMASFASMATAPLCMLASSRSGACARQDPTPSLVLGATSLGIGVLGTVMGVTTKVRRINQAEAARKEAATLERELAWYRLAIYRGLEQKLGGADSR
jgi:hypothetical protein